MAFKIELTMKQKVFIVSYITHVCLNVTWLFLEVRPPGQRKLQRQSFDVVFDGLDLGSIFLLGQFLLPIDQFGSGHRLDLQGELEGPIDEVHSLSHLVFSETSSRQRRSTEPDAAGIECTLVAWD